jgi:radical SAM superfamily enzyme YgiQ (UPF0313 family)
MSKKLMLISPHPPGNVGEENVSVLTQMPLSLGYLKTLTPGDWEVDVIDETQEPAIHPNGGGITFDGADLVGISAMSHQAPRAYEVATACREQGIPVVIGGWHPTSYPEEARPFVDTVCTREAFTAWPQIIQDFERGELKSHYDGGLHDLSILKDIRPDREFLRSKYNYRYTAAIASAGCPYTCEFCFIPLFQGRKYRERPVDDLVQELEEFKGQYRGMIWTDENFYGHSKLSHDRTVALYRSMAERGIKQNWFGFTSIHIAEDDEVMHWMAQSGSVGMLIGFESIQEETLKLLNKKFNHKATGGNYKRSLDRIHKHGLAVWGTLIFGTDTETPDVFERAADFVLDNDIDIMTCGLETPAPGTKFYDRLAAEGRIFRNNYPQDWQYGTAHHLLYLLKSMPLDEFIGGLEHMYDRLYTTEALRQRFARSRETLDNLAAAYFAFKVNLDWQQVFQHLIGNLKDLRESGEYEQALWRYQQQHGAAVAS